MIDSQYALPHISFVGGTSKDIDCAVYESDGVTPVNLTGCSAAFSMSNFVNRDAYYISGRIMGIDPDSTGDKHIVRVSLTHNDTKDIYGRFVYEITITDTNSHKYCHQGLIDIFRSNAAGQIGG